MIFALLWDHVHNGVNDSPSVLLWLQRCRLDVTEETVSDRIFCYQTILAYLSHNSLLKKT